MQNDNYYTLITGADTGTGKQIAIECAKRGFNLFLVSLPETGLEDLAADLQQTYGVQVRHLGIDLTKRKSPRQVYNFARMNNLRVNFLVNNAGLGFNGKLEKMSRELIDTMIFLNIRASTLLICLFLSEMKQYDKGYILNISSFGALSPVPFKSVYAATKTYLLFLTRALQHELKGTNISATSVHPCGIKSERAMNNIKKSGFFARISALTPEEVATESVRNLLSGRTFVIPGLVNKIYYLLGSLLPYGLILRITGTVFQKSE